MSQASLVRPGTGLRLKMSSCADSKRPPVDRGQVAFLGEDFRSHVSHRSREAGEHLATRITDGDLKLREGVTPN